MREIRYSKAKQNDRYLLRKPAQKTVRVTARMKNANIIEIINFIQPHHERSHFHEFLKRFC